MKRVVLLSFALVVVWAAISPSEAFVQYESHYLRPPTHGNCLARSINNSGQVAGSYYSTSSVQIACLWQSMSALGMSLGTLGGANSYAYGLSDNGKVVGYSETSAGDKHAFLWDNGVMSDLGSLGGTRSYAYGVNDFGDVVGVSTVATGEEHAFLYHNGVMQDLGGAAAAYSGAQAINDSGQVVGCWRESRYGRRHAVRWTNGVMEELGTLGGSYGEAYDINASGDIVGLSSTLSSGFHAFLWHSGTMQDLGTLGADASCADAISDNGIVLGHIFIVDPAYADPGHPVIYDALNGMRSVRGAPNGQYGYAYDINDSGWIAGNGDDNGYGCVAVPVPEPSAIAGLICPIVALSFGRALRRRCA